MFSLAGLGSGLVLTGSFYPLYAALKGELLPGPGHVSLWDAIRFQLSDRPPSGSMFTAGTGSNQLVLAWLALDPVVVVGGTVALVAGLAVRRLRPLALGGVLLAAVGMRPNGYLPAMYIVGLLPFYAICVAGLVESVTRRVVSLPLPAPFPDRLRRAALVGAGLAAAGATVAGWAPGQWKALTVDVNKDRAAALAFLRTAVAEPYGVRVLVDDGLWLDLKTSGFDPVWFYKADLDSAVRKELPRGWRDFDYVVSSGIMRQDAARLRTVRDTLTNSRLLAGFGEGYSRFEIRRVNGE
jgi:hypothetical protein